MSGPSVLEKGSWMFLFEVRPVRTGCVVTNLEEEDFPIVECVHARYVLMTLYLDERQGKKFFFTG